MPVTPTDPAIVADAMRRAANAMRRLANDVTTVGHDWTVHPPEGDTEWTIGAGTVRVAETPDYGGLELPDHIASWTPPIALLVADLLDTLAADVERVVEAHDGRVSGTLPAEWTAAHNLATAYLDRAPHLTDTTEIGA